MYGDRVRDLEPTERALMWVYGTIPSWLSKSCTVALLGWFRRDRARASLRNVLSTQLLSAAVELARR